MILVINEIRRIGRTALEKKKVEEIRDGDGMTVKALE